MQIDLGGRTAIITGSTAGIGYAIAKGLAASGARVVVNGRGRPGTEAAATRLRAEVPGAAVLAAAADLGTDLGCAALVAAMPEADILVNNVGIYVPQDFFDIPDAEWTRFHDINILSGVRLARAYLPGMAARGWGRVIFVSSESGLNIPVDMIHYGMTKTANLALSRGLAKRMAGTGVTVNAILPGPTLTEGVEEMFRAEQARTGRPVADLARDFVRAERPTSIIGRAATAEEVANLAVYVASPQASATTGAALRVDGGVVDTIA